VQKVIFLISLLGFWICLVPAPGGGAGEAKDGVPDGIEGEYGPVPFDHSEHVDMASGCGDCHHQHGPGESLSCRECHRLDPASFRRAIDGTKFRPCRECHPSGIRPDAPETPTLKAAYHRVCFRCHEEFGSVGRDPKGCTGMCHSRKTRADQGGRLGQAELSGRTPAASR
jgi:hypothetical protein